MSSFYPTNPIAHKSKSSRKSKASEPHEVHGALIRHCHVPGALQTTRLRELSPAGCSPPPSLKPRPPSTPRVRERPSSGTCIPSISVAGTDTINRECIPLRKKDAHMTVHTAAGQDDAPTARQKHRNHKEQTSEKVATKDQTLIPSLRGSSSLDHKSPSRKTQSATQAPISTRTHKEHNKEQRRRRNEAACIIQRAWRR